MNIRHTLISLSFVVASSTLGPLVFAQEQQTTMQWGPIELPAAANGEPGQVHNEIAGASAFSSFLLGFFTDVADYGVPKPCSDCYITSIEPNLVLADGTPANLDNGTMLHHVVNVNFSRPDVTCRPNLFSGETIKLLGAITGGNERFYAAGNERTNANISDGYGYYVAPGDQWGLIYHLMNMSPVAKTVYFEYTFTWVSASQSNVERVRPIWIDIDQCDDSEVVVPAGYSDITWSWQSDRSHKVTDIGGHVHNYGISIAWKNESKDQTICTSVAGYAAGSSFVPIGPGTGADAAHPVSYNTVTSDPLGLASFNGNISDMTTCSVGSSGPKINKGNQMKAYTQIYRPDETDHDMGIMVGFMDEDFCITNFWCF